MRGIPSLERKLATLIRLFGEPIDGGWVLNIPLAEVARTPERTVVIPCDNPGFAVRATKKNPFGIMPMVGLCTSQHDPRGHGIHSLAQPIMEITDTMRLDWLLGHPGADMDICESSDMHSRAYYIKGIEVVHRLRWFRESKWYVAYGRDDWRDCIDSAIEGRVEEWK